MNGYADDLASRHRSARSARDVTLVGHSTGGGEVARYIGRYGTERVAKAVLIAAVPPLMLKTAANPEGLPMEVFDSDSGRPHQGSVRNTTEDLATPFYGANRPGRQSLAGHARSVLAVEHASWSPERVRKHQSVFRNGLARRI